jgi:hypothetical protein
MRETSSPLFIAVLLGFALTGAALILSIPPLFEPHEPARAWTTAGLAGLAIVLAVGMLHLRPGRRPPPAGDADDD